MTKWNRLFLAAIFAALLTATSLATWGTQPAYADSTTSISFPVNQATELWREVDGYSPLGIGINERAGRLREGVTFTDHILVRNTENYPVPFIQIVGYWSSPTLIFRGWSGENWTFESSPNPERYVARFASSDGIAPNQIGELKIEFQVKSPLPWNRIAVPQAVHTLDYVLGTSGKEDGALLSYLFTPRQDTAFGWGATSSEFFVDGKMEGTNSTFFTAHLRNPYNVQSKDLGLPSTYSGFGGASSRNCESWAYPDIRTGETFFRQGSCDHNTSAISPVTGNPIPNGGHFGLLYGKSAFSWYNINPDQGNLRITVSSAGYNFIDLRIPEGQAIEVSFQQFVPSLGTREVTMTFWHTMTGWRWVNGVVTFEPADYTRQGLWNTNFHTTQLGVFNTVFNELPRI